MVVNTKPKCQKCKSRNGYVRISTNEFVCRVCGTITLLDKK